MIRTAILLATVLAAPAHAATITRQDAGVTGPGWSAAILTGERLGACSIGGASIGCAPIPATAIPPLVRYGQDLDRAINSQDTDILGLTFSSGEAFDRLWIETRDAHDQRRSHWALELEGATAALLERRPDGARAGWLVTLDRAVTSVVARISTRLGDGYSVSGRVCRQGRG